MQLIPLEKIRSSRDSVRKARESHLIDTVFIRISAQPRISAHLEQAPILKAEKVNKRPASNKRPPLLLPIKLKQALTPNPSTWVNKS